MIDYDDLYYLELDISTEDAISTSFATNQFRQTGYNLNGLIDMWHIPYEDLPNVFNMEWIESLKYYGIDTTEAIIFYREAEYFHKNLHIDISRESKIMSNGVNFVLDPNDDSEMVWYELDNPSEEYIMSTIKYTEHNLPYASWETDDIPGKEVKRKVIGRQLTLVKTSVPHTVVTHTLPRWSFSLRSRELSDWSWKEAIDHFGKFIKQ